MINKIISFFTSRHLLYAICLTLLIFSGKVTIANTADSLSSKLKTHTQNDTTRVTLLCSLSMAYINNNVDSAIIFANEGLSISQKIAFEKGEALCMQALGLAYLNKNQYDKALVYYNNALKLVQKTGKSEATSLTYCHIGDVYAREAKHGEAMEYYKKSISLSREIKDESVEALALMNMASLYSDLGNLSEALKSYLDALKIFEKEQNADALSTCMSNIATIYSSLGDHKRALDYNNQSLAIFQKTGNKMGVLSTMVNSGLIYGEMNDYRSTISLLNKAVKLADSIGDKYFKDVCLANIGEAYFNLNSFDTAYEKYIIALHEAESMNDKASIAQSENGIGSVLVKKGKPEQGIKHLLVSYDIMRDAGMKTSVQEIAQNLSEAYEKMHDFPSALKYYKIYSAYTDSLYNEKNDKRIQQLQFDYELGKKENQITLLQKDKVIEENKNEKQTAIIWVSLISLAILIVASILLYRSRAYEKHNKEEILKQKEEIQLQATKLAELNRFKDKTFSVLSHDLRGPIDSFYSIITLLDQKAITSEEYLILKPEMTAQIASLTILLDNLLKWASNHMKGQIAAKPANTSIQNIARQNINLLKTAASKKQITINNEIPESIFAYCDAAQMDIMIRNLTMNAIKFTKHNGAITLSATSDQDNVYISIADNGVGMTKEQLNKLFLIAPDNHTYGTDGETGTGLGLLLCYEFVKANNGIISVSSEKNVGSTFTIKIKKATA